LKTAKCGAFCKTCSITNRVIEQVQYTNSLFTALFDNEDKAGELYAALKGIVVFYSGTEDTPDQLCPRPPLL
jgi:hypothetical protein